MFHKPPNNVLVQLRPNLELLNHKTRRTLKRSIPIDVYIYVDIYIDTCVCYICFSNANLIFTSRC